MKAEYKISASLAWQSYDCIDMLFILNRGNGSFYFFQESGRFIVERILQNQSISKVLDDCRETYETFETDLVEAVEQFVELLLCEEIIYESTLES